MGRPRKEPEAEGGTTDGYAFAGQAETVEMVKGHCNHCGGRMQRIVDRYTGELRRHCRGCGR